MILRRGIGLLTNVWTLTHLWLGRKLALSTFLQMVSSSNPRMSVQSILRKEQSHTKSKSSSFSYASTASPSAISRSVTFISKVHCEVVIVQCFISRDAPFISPAHQRVIVSAGPLSLPSRDTARSIVHHLEVGIRKTDERFPQVLKTVTDVVMTRTMILLARLIAHLHQIPVYRCPKSLS